MRQRALALTHRHTRKFSIYTVFIIFDNNKHQQSKTTLYLSAYIHPPYSVYIWKQTFAWHSALRMTLDFSKLLFRWPLCFCFLSMEFFFLFRFFSCIMRDLRRLSLASITFLVRSRRFCCCCCYVSIVAYDF